MGKIDELIGLLKKPLQVDVNILLDASSNITVYLWGASLMLLGGVIYKYRGGREP